MFMQKFKSAVYLHTQAIQGVAEFFFSRTLNIFSYNSGPW